MLISDVNGSFLQSFKNLGTSCKAFLLFFFFKRVIRQHIVVFLLISALYDADNVLFERYVS